MKDSIDWILSPHALVGTILEIDPHIPGEFLHIPQVAYNIQMTFAMMSILFLVYSALGAFPDVLSHSKLFSRNIACSPVHQKFIAS